MRLDTFKRELAAALTLILLLLVVAVFAPGFFSPANIRDLILNNSPVLLVATGMTIVILVGEIDISVGSQFALISVAAGALAKSGTPVVLLIPATLAIGASLGAINGALVGPLGLPSIIVTLAMLVALRDGLRWITEGAWVQNLPSNFQWFGIGQTLGQLIIVALTLVLFVSLSWTLRNLSVGRTLYAVGSDRESARLAGIEPRLILFGAFVCVGALTGLAALLNAVRFSSVPSNLGIGLELKAVAAVVVGGTAITGGRGRLAGTFIGVVLLGTIGTALTFLGINPFWEKALQGAIILIALISDTVIGRIKKLKEAPDLRVEVAG